jgi:hypothetical protein
MENDTIQPLFTLQDVLHDKDLNAFFDHIMTCNEVMKITLANSVIEHGSDCCDLDIDVEITGGRASEKLSEVLTNYKTVRGFWHNLRGTPEFVGHHGSRFFVVGQYHLEISWGVKPYTVPYVTLRERGLRKKKWVP